MATAKTNAVRLLERGGVGFELHEYPVDEAALDAVSVARTMRVEPERVFKTLVTVSDSGEHLVFCLPGIAGLDVKKAAAASGSKRVALIRLRELEPLTGYVHGGCSPLGMKRSFRTWIDESAELFETVFVSAGARGVQVEIAPAELLSQTDAMLADLTG